MMRLDLLDDYWPPFDYPEENSYCPVCGCYDFYYTTVHGIMTGSAFCNKCNTRFQVEKKGVCGARPIDAICHDRLPDNLALPRSL